MKTLTSIAIAIFGVLASAQYTIDPNSVPIDTRDAWCESQIAQCPLICLQTSAHSSETRQNDCVAQTLTYSCVCSNGLSPNVSQYSLTLPYFICQEWGNQCAAACGQNNACASACRTNHPCGAQNPTRVNTTTTSSGPGAHPATGKPGGYTGFADGHGSNAAASSKPLPFSNAQMSEVLSWVGMIFATLVFFALGL